MGAPKDQIRATGPPAQAPPKDIDAVCDGLQAIRRQLTQVSSVGGGSPTEGLLLAAADDCVDAVIVTNNEAKIIMVNGPAARLTGLSTRELQSTTVWDISHAASQVDFEVLWKGFLRAGRQRGTFALRHRDGMPVEVAYCSEANVLPNRHVSVLRKRAQQG